MIFFPTKIRILLPVWWTNALAKIYFVNYFTAVMIYFFTRVLLLAVGMGPTKLMAQVLKSSFMVTSITDFGGSKAEESFLKILHFQSTSLTLVYMVPTSSLP